MTTQILPFRPEAHAEAVAAISRECLPVGEVALSAKQILEQDAKLNPKVYRRRWVAVDGETESAQAPLGHAMLTHNAVFWNPDQYIVDIQVAPAARRRGVASALLREIERTLAERRAAFVRGSAHESAPEGVEFLRKRGFEETHRMWQSIYRLADFDERPYADRMRDLVRAGIRFTSVKELFAEGGARAEHHRRKIYELEREVNADIPASGEETGLSQADFWEAIGRDMGDGSLYLVAMRGEDYLGLNLSYRLPGSSRANLILTGTARAARGLGVATALKVEGLVRARAAGLETQSTWNDSRNRPMLSINEKLGFKRLPARIFLRRELR